MTIKIATCGWGAPFEEFCAIAAETGYAGIETNLDEWIDRENDLRAILKRHALEIAACSAGGSFQDPEHRAEDIQRVIETVRRMRDFGIQTLEIHCPARPVGGPTAEQIKGYADGLNEVGRQCSEMGIKIGIHNHCIQFLETEAEIDLLYRYLDPAYVGIGFDTGHLALAGCDPAAVLQRQIERGFKVAYLHLKDLYQVSQPAGDSERVMDFDELLGLATNSDILTWLVIKDMDGRRVVLGGGSLGHRFLEGHRGLLGGVRCRDITEYQFCEIGQGMIHFAEIFTVLRQSGYDGWAAVELDVAYRPRSESAAISRQTLKQKFGL